MENEHLSRKILSDLIIHTKYAKYIPEKKRREAWEELCKRNMDMHIKKYPMLKEEIEKVYEDFVLTRKVLPSLRSMQFAGKPIEINPTRIFNCSALAVSTVGAFSEVMFLLLSGTGVGISVQKHHIEQLPIVKHPLIRKRRFLVGDSIEGWSDAIKVLMEAYFYGKSDPIFDFSDIRPKGERLITSGGKAPGPQPLKDCIHQIRKILDNVEPNEQLRPIQVHDICCHISDSVLSGGIRRSSMISMFSLSDEEMLRSKYGSWWVDNPQRGRANNSAVLLRHRIKRKDFFELWEKVEKSGCGEPGFIFSNDPEQLVNPCLTGDTKVAIADGTQKTKTIKQLAEENEDVPVFCLDDKTNVVVRMMRNPRITGFKKPIYKTLLDNGEYIKTTGDHKFKLSSGEYKKVSDLIPGDSLYIMNKYLASIKDIFPKSNSRSQDYWWLKITNKSRSFSEHRAIIKYNNNLEKIDKNFVVHHKDFNAQNNVVENLVLMSKMDHDKLHGDCMRGKNNPMVRAKYEWSKKKWEDYKNKLSSNNKGEKNKNFSGYTNEQLRENAKELVRKLGRRFTAKEWIKFARERGLPTKFTKWRERNLNGGMCGLSKWAAIEEGYYFLEGEEDIDFRTFRKYLRELSEGYDCIIKNERVCYNKKCAFCGREFSSFRKEQSYCTAKCSYKYKEGINIKIKKIKNLKKKNVGNQLKTSRTENAIFHIVSENELKTLSASERGKRYWEDKECREYMLKRMKETSEVRKEILREKQYQVYYELKGGLGRAPMKKEWAKACKEKNISAEMSRDSSPFRYYKDLQNYIPIVDNHKVVKVELCGYEDVYNGTVDEFHNFFVGGFEEKTEKNKRKVVFLNNLQCGEASLRTDVRTGTGTFCNLTEINSHTIISQQDFEERAKAAAFLGTLQAGYTDFHYLRDNWQKNTEKDSLLGVGITGIASNRLSNLNIESAAGEVIKENKRVASILQINTAARTNVVKPAGTSSLLIGCSSGIHAWHSQYYIRRLRVGKNEAIYKYLLKKMPKLIEDDFEKPHLNAILSIPVKAPDGAILRKDETAIDFLKRIKKFYNEWILPGHIKGNNTHSISATVSVKDNEWDIVGKWLWENKNSYNCISVLPYSGGTYTQMPFEECDEETYEEMLKQIKNIDLTKVTEEEDNTKQTQEFACSGGSCTITHL